MKIVIEPKTYNNEILSSWLIRSSILNGSEPSSWTTMIFNDNKFWSKDFDRFTEDKELIKLVKGSTKSLQELKNMTLEPLVKKILPIEEINPNKTWTFIISTGKRGAYKRNGTYFCPLCIENENSFNLRREFRLAWNTSCSIHKINLLQKFIINNSVKSVLFAITPSIANDAFILFIESKLKDYNLKFSKIAQGVPTGVSLENVDILSLSKAIQSKVEI
jgi:hypothetical protein